MHTNALANEKSPYLRQHSHNPVDWLPWGEEAFKKARRENKPIFLSIGYSTCHWCHVMAHESFESEDVAAVLNRDFVAIKIDREERPDIDRIYMLFVQATTGSGGWPMSVWLTPDLKPFYGGTYFPPDYRYGRPGFKQVLEQLAHAWRTDRQRIEESGASVAAQLESISSASSARGTEAAPDWDLFAKAYWQFRRTFDGTYGGFGSAPKFPRPSALLYLLRFYAKEQNADALDMVVKTLEGMAAGGMHDHLGGGFHRYSVDERWFVPHFEKMLYDQAQLVIAYLEAYQLTRNSVFARVARDILEYVLRDMTDPNGAFYSAEDADSPDPDNPSHSGEGAFYIWKQTEIDALLPPAVGRLFSLRYGLEPTGNVANDPQGEFTGRNILYQAVTESEIAARLDLNFDAVRTDLEKARSTLFHTRTHRPRPHLDKKVLVSWNALMISAFAKASHILDEPGYLEAARKATAFINTHMVDPSSKRLLRRFCEGEAAVFGFADDYAFFMQALLDLFEATFDPVYFRDALALGRDGLSRFEDLSGGGFFSTEAGSSDVLIRLKDDYDGAEPSANSVAADVLLRLAHITGEDDFRERALRAITHFAGRMHAQPTMSPQMLTAVARLLSEPEQVIIRCQEIDSTITNRIRDYRRNGSPYLLALALTDEATSELRGISTFLAGLDRKGTATIYECKNFVCALPQVVGAS